MGRRLLRDPRHADLRRVDFRRQMIGHELHRRIIEPNSIGPPVGRMEKPHPSPAKPGRPDRGAL